MSPFVSHLVLQASAGSGKTYQLVRRYISLLAQGAAPDKVLAATFSRKAAQEILERILELLLCCCEDSAVAAEVAREIGTDSFTPLVAEDLLRRMLFAPSSLPIGTLDSFIQRFARLFSEELGLASDWQIPSLVEAEQLESEALHTVLQAHSGSEKRELLSLITSPESSQSVFQRLFGKVRRLQQVAMEGEAEDWIWNLADLGIVPEELSSTVSREDVLERMQELPLPLTKKGEPDKRWKKAREEGALLVEQQEWKAFAGRGIASSLLRQSPTFYGREISAEWCECYGDALTLARVSLATDLLRRTAIVRGFLSFYGEQCAALGKVYRRYGFTEVKRALAAGLHAVASSELAYRMDRSIDHVLLDEFQDTTVTEWRILRMLTDEIIQSSEQDRSLFIVGDPKQSIYGWRGALPELFRGVVESYPSVKQETLGKSYRSSPTVIEFVNRIFTVLPEAVEEIGFREVAERWQENFPEHQTAREIPGYVEISAVVEADLEEESDTPYAVAEKIAALFRKNSQLEVAILLRTNDELLPYVRACEAKGLRVSAEGGSLLTDSQVVVAVLHLLHLIASPGDSRSEYLVRATPLAAWLPTARSGTAQALSRFRREIESGHLARFLRRAVSLFSDISDQNDEVRAEQLLQMAQHRDAEMSGGALVSIGDFVQHVRTSRVELGTRGVVRVMTIHRSKGLEFDAVFLPQLSYSLQKLQERDILRTPLSGDEFCSRVLLFADKSTRSALPVLETLYQGAVAAQVKEEFSLLYVALTRAKSALYLSVSEERSTKVLTAESVVMNALRCQDLPVNTFGEESWYEGGTSGAPADESSEGERGEISFPVLPQQRLRFLATRTPSQEYAARDRSERQQELLSRDPSKRGKFLHALCEKISWQEQIVSDGTFEGLPRLCSRFGVPYPEGEQIWHTLLEQLQSPEIAPLFSLSRYGAEAPRLFRELPFSFYEEESKSLVHGIVDRVVVYTSPNGGGERAEVVDFKTGYTRLSREEVRERFFPQLALYSAGIKRVFPALKEVGVLLCCLDRREVIDL
ncbi:UvrD-helicase domain-containing protein [bacterium]|nr:UvrD-helicase domain-containing protein [bacterium]